jgi:thioredoxin reductase
MENIQHKEYIILGAGPAGLQLGYYFEKENKDYTILEQGNNPGTSFEKFPKHRKLISINKIHTGETDPELKLRHDWNSLLTDDYQLWFSDYDKNYFPHPDSLCTYLKDFSTLYNLKISYNSQVNLISKLDNGYRLTLNNGTSISCTNLIIATGVGKPYLPSIPGIELVTQYEDISLDLKPYEDKTVLVIGKGNSGFETADHLISAARTIHICSPTPLKLAWKTHFVGNLRAVNNNFLDTYQLKSQNAVLDGDILKIEKIENKFAVTYQYHQADEVEKIIYDNVICCTGFQLDHSIFSENAKPSTSINNRFPNQSFEWESENQENMFFIGTLMQLRDYKKANSGFIHGFRYNVKALNTILNIRNHQKSWHAETLDLEPNSIASQIIKHINESGALWQQSTFICGIIEVNDKKTKVKYYSDVPKDYAINKIVADNSHYFTVTLEFGKEMADPFDARRPAGVETDKANTSNFLHPVIREYDNDSLISEHHIIENLYGEWKSFEEHQLPLEEYISRQIYTKNSNSRTKNKTEMA